MTIRELDFIRGDFPCLAYLYQFRGLMSRGKGAIQTVPSRLTSLLEDGVSALVNRLILDERRLDEQREFPRIPFCRPVLITSAGSESNMRRVQWAASTRDISQFGIGLLSRTPVEPGSEFILTIPQRCGVPAIFKTRMMWCEPATDGWYHIGGRFIESIEALSERLDIVV